MMLSVETQIETTAMAGEQASPVILTSTLSAREKQHLEFSEKIIEDGKRAFVRVGVALMEIRDSRLYREDHATFEAYCQKRWGFGRVQAHRLIEAANVAEELLPTGNTPVCERQARPLVPLEPAQRVEAWTAANEVAASEARAVTTHDVEAAVTEIIDEPERPRIRTADEELAEEQSSRKAHRLSCGMMYADSAIEQLKKIQLTDTEREKALNHVQKWIGDNQRNANQGPLRRLRNNWYAASSKHRAEFIRFVGVDSFRLEAA